MLHLKNAADVLDPRRQASFAPTILLGLGDQGLRDLVRRRQGRRTCSIAGDPGDGGAFALWKWTGPGATPAARVGHRPADRRHQGLGRRPGRRREGGRGDGSSFDEGERKNAAGGRVQGL